MLALRILIYLQMRYFVKNLSLFYCLLSCYEAVSRCENVLNYIL